MYYANIPTYFSRQAKMSQKTVGLISNSIRIPVNTICRSSLSLVNHVVVHIQHIIIILGKNTGGLLIGLDDKNRHVLSKELDLLNKQSSTWISAKKYQKHPPKLHTVRARKLKKVQTKKHVCNQILSQLHEKIFDQNPFFAISKVAKNLYLNWENV